MEEEIRVTKTNLEWKENTMNFIKEANKVSQGGRKVAIRRHEDIEHYENSREYFQERSEYKSYMLFSFLSYREVGEKLLREKGASQEEIDEINKKLDLEKIEKFIKDFKKERSDLKKQKNELIKQKEKVEEAKEIIKRHEDLIRKFEITKIKSSDPKRKKRLEVIINYLTDKLDQLKGVKK